MEKTAMSVLPSGILSDRTGRKPQISPREVPLPQKAFQYVDDMRYNGFA